MASWAFAYLRDHRGQGHYPVSRLRLSGLDRMILSTSIPKQVPWSCESRKAYVSILQEDCHAQCKYDYITLNERLLYFSGIFSTHRNPVNFITRTRIITGK